MRRDWTNYRAPLQSGARRIGTEWLGVIGAAFVGAALAVAILAVLS